MPRLQCNRLANSGKKLINPCIYRTKSAHNPPLYPPYITIVRQIPSPPFSAKICRAYFALKIRHIFANSTNSLGKIMPNFPNIIIKNSSNFEVKGDLYTICGIFCGKKWRIQFCACPKVLQYEKYCAIMTYKSAPMISAVILRA